MIKETGLNMKFRIVEYLNDKPYPVNLYSADLTQHEYVQFNTAVDTSSANAASVFSCALVV